MHGKIWLKRVLVPFWVIEMIWLVVLLAVSSFDLSEYRYNALTGLGIGGIILICMSGISIIFDITAIILFSRHMLTPKTYLVFQCIKAVFWTYILIADVRSLRYGRANFALVFSIPLFLASIGQLAYGSVIMDRKRKGKLALGGYRGNYAGVENGQFAAGYESPPRGSYAAYNPHGGAPPNPFRDPSLARVASPIPSASTAQQPTPLHPAFRQSSGAADEFYNAPEVAHNSYEMQNTGYRDH